MEGGFECGARTQTCGGDGERQSQQPERFWACVQVVAAAKFGYAARSERDGWVRNRMGRAVV